MADFGQLLILIGGGLIFLGFRKLVVLLLDMHRRDEDVVKDEFGKLSDVVVWSGEGHQDTHDMLHHLIQITTTPPPAPWHSPCGYHTGR